MKERTCIYKIMLLFMITSKEARQHFAEGVRRKVSVEISGFRWYFVEIHHQRLNSFLNEKTAFQMK